MGIALFAAIVVIVAIALLKKKPVKRSGKGIILDDETGGQHGDHVKDKIKD